MHAKAFCVLPQVGGTAPAVRSSGAGAARIAWLSAAVSSARWPMKYDHIHSIKIPMSQLRDAYECTRLV